MDLFIFVVVDLSFIATKSNQPERFFLRGISPFKMFPP